MATTSAAGALPASSATALEPRPPPGYASIRVLPSEILLELTISNRCGQAFRWRSNDVWERRCVEEHAAADLKPGHMEDQRAVLEPPRKSLDYSHPGIKTDPDAEPVRDTWPRALLQPSSVKVEDKEQLQTISLHHEAAQWQRWTEYSIALSDRVVLLRQDVSRGYIYHRTRLPSSVEDRISPEVYIEHYEKSTEAWLLDYLNLRVPLDHMYQEWAARDKVFARFAKRFAGVRMLRQDPWECLCAFICSSNNNIARIGQMVMALSHRYSSPLLTLEYPPAPAEVSITVDAAAEAKAEPTRVTYHPFPPAAALIADDVEHTLRNELAFGYRAKYLSQTARALAEAHTGVEPRAGYECSLASGGPDTAALPVAPHNLSRPATPPPTPRPRIRKRLKTESGVGNDHNEAPDIPDDKSALRMAQSPTSFLYSLRSMPYVEARAELIKFQGIGPKVADCILLMSMDQPSSIPVDRHVYQFAARWYGMRVKEGNKGYEELAERFRQLWGDYAGWAHSVIFTADLRSFQNYKKDAGESGASKEEADNGDTSTSGAGTTKMVLPALPAAPFVAAQPEDAAPAPVTLGDTDKKVAKRRPLPSSRRSSTIEFASTGKESTHRPRQTGKSVDQSHPSQHTEMAQQPREGNDAASHSQTMADRVKNTRRSRR